MADVAWLGYLFDYEATNFNGVNQSMKHTGVLTGLSNGKAGTVSFWMRWDSGGSLAFLPVLANSAFDFFVRKTDDDTVQVSASNSTPTTIMDIRSVVTTYQTWQHFLIAWDLTSTSNRYCYINGVNTGFSNTSPYTNDTIAYNTAVDWYGGGDANGRSFLGCLSEIWFDPTFTAFSAGFLAKFYNSTTGKPVFLGSDGSLPLGTAPAIYFHSNAGSAFDGTNAGTGGNFTVQNGPLTVCASKE